ncbi:MAG: 2-oxo acid dehydrogenase, partial [Deltaproteobacteria bacterium]
MAGFVPLKNPSPFRKMAAVMWPRPKEPLIFGSLDVDVTKARRLMERYREVYGVKLTITHFVIKAFALAL